MATKKKEVYKLYILYKGNKRYMYERSYPLKSMCEIEGTRIMTDLYLKHVVKGYKVTDKNGKTVAKNY
jgi:hypothetical protein